MAQILKTRTPDAESAIQNQALTPFFLAEILPPEAPALAKGLGAWHDGTMLLALHHAAIICSDYARSKAFYTETLGLKILHEVHRAERQSWKLDLALPDGGQIELFSFPEPPPRPSRPEAQGLRHLAFAVADVAAAKAALEAKGVAVEPIRIDPYTDRAFTFFQDPDGLPLELYEAP